MQVPHISGKNVIGWRTLTLKIGGGIDHGRAARSRAVAPAAMHHMLAGGRKRVLEGEKET